jgi:hypothetical protein
MNGRHVRRKKEFGVGLIQFRHGNTVHLKSGALTCLGHIGLIRDLTFGTILRAVGLGTRAVAALRMQTKALLVVSVVVKTGSGVSSNFALSKLLF